VSTDPYAPHPRPQPDPVPPAGWGPPPPAPDPSGAGTGGRAARRGPTWPALVATGAALLAAGATAVVTGAAGDDDPAAIATADRDSSRDAAGADTEPVTATTAGTPDWVALAADVGPTVVAIDVRTASGSGAGSGVIVTEDGRIVTNHHVVGGAVRGGIVVTLSDGRMFSGGPLFDAAGRVIRINSSIASMPSGAGGASGSIGLGFAIPSNLVELIAGQLDEDGVAEHAYLGVTLGDAVTRVGDETRSGAQVQSVEPNTPAESAGLQPGDVIVRVGDEAVTGAESLTGVIRAHASGDEVSLTVARDGEAVELEATLVTREDQLP